MIYNIAIDGPSGAGKSTIAKFLAKTKSIAYLDTGAMYRGVGYYVLQKGVAPEDIEGVKALLPELNMEIFDDNGTQQVVVCGENITPFIRQHEISMAASTVSKIPEVRKKLVALQQEIAKKTSCVLDGRDICTVVLPDAKYKFFVTASPAIRAERRFLELREKGSSLSYAEVHQDIVARDKQDTERETDPLKQADDAILIDTSNMSIEEVLAEINKYICE